MAAEALRKDDVGRQLTLDERWTRPSRRKTGHQRSPSGPPLCAGCRAREARYGFGEDPQVDRPRTLCFECFRMELSRRAAVAAQLARGWNARAVRLPLAATLETLDRRRRRAQIAARRALG